ncbi:hypothetical protein KKA66_00945, partial [Patescibacteria group bacterium]|nr:hypothetical protein [Patescibacteria group bacterium]
TFSTDANFNYAGGDAAIAGVLNVGGVSYFDGAVQATSTLFVTDAATFYSLATFTTATSTSATTTEYLYVGHDISEPTGWDFAGGDLAVSGDAYFNNKATTSVAFTIGAPTANYINFAGGDLIVQGDVEVDGGIWTNSATTTDTLSIGGNATTSGETVLGATAPGNSATTTLTFGSYGTADTKGLCLKFFSGGVTIWCYFNTAALTGGAPTSTAFLCDSDSSTCE